MRSQATDAHRSLPTGAIEGSEGAQACSPGREPRGRRPTHPQKPRRGDGSSSRHLVSGRQTPARHPWSRLRLSAMSPAANQILQTLTTHRDSIRRYGARRLGLLAPRREGTPPARATWTSWWSSSPEPRPSTLYGPEGVARRPLRPPGGPRRLQRHQAAFAGCDPPGDDLCPGILSPGGLIPGVLIPGYC
jgi:hypothetical protein